MFSEKGQRLKSCSYSMNSFRFYILSLIVFTAFLLPPSMAKGQIDSTRAKIELKSSVDRSRVPLGQMLTFMVQASWEGEQDRFSITPVGPPECENFEILGTSSLNEATVEEGRIKSIRTFKFMLKPTQTGRGRIGSVKLSYVDNLTQDSSSLSTQPINVQIEPPVEKKRPGYKTLLIMVILLVLIYVVYSAKTKKRRKEASEGGKTKEFPDEEKSLEEATLSKLEAISEKAQTKGEEDLPSDVYKLLIGFLEAKYQIVTSGKTTDDIIGSLSNLNLPEERISLLKEILSTCDLAKFAGERLGKKRCEKIADLVKKFLEQSQREIVK